MHVEVEYKRQGRKVGAVKFKIRRLKELPMPLAVQGALFPDINDMPQVVNDLIQAGISRNQALKIWNTGFDFVDADKRSDGWSDNDFDAYLEEKIHLLKSQSERKIDNKAAFLRQAIKENWQLSEGQQETVAQREQEQAQEALEEQAKAIQM